jgi:hypothetical protein
MTDRPSPITPPIQAGPARRVFHALVTLAGWLLFVYWWWIVFHRVSRHEVRFTAIFIAISLGVIVLVTLAWAWHNLRIFKHRGPRTHVRETTPDFSHDGVGRTVEFTAGGLDPQTAPVIHVRFTGEGKAYEFSPWLPPRAEAIPQPSAAAGPRPRSEVKPRPPAAPGKSGS